MTQECLNINTMASKHDLSHITILTLTVEVVHDVGYISLTTVYACNFMNRNPLMFGWWSRTCLLFGLVLPSRPTVAVSASITWCCHDGMNKATLNTHINICCSTMKFLTVLK